MMKIYSLHLAFPYLIQTQISLFNLQRTELTQEQFPFEKELFEDVSKDFISFILVNAPAYSLMNLLQPIGMLYHHSKDLAHTLKDEFRRYHKIWVLADGFSITQGLE